MRKLIGAVVVFIAFVLVMSEIQASDSLVSRLVPGWALNRTVWLWGGGAVAVMVGVWLIWFRVGPPT